MTFEEVIGQDEAKLSLVKLIEEHRVPHAMLFLSLIHISEPTRPY